MKSVQKNQVTSHLQMPRNKDILSLEKRLNDNLGDVLTWFVERKSTTVIQELLKEKFKIDISRMGVWRFSQSRKWRPIIERGRIELAKHIAKIPCANKEIRLLVLQKVIEEGLKWSLKSYDKEGNAIYELKLSAVTEAVKAAREEIEGSKLRIEGKGLVSPLIIIEKYEQSKKEEDVSINRIAGITETTS